jgi:hypothetical protein
MGFQKRMCAVKWVSKKECVLLNGFPKHGALFRSLFSNFGRREMMKATNCCLLADATSSVQRTSIDSSHRPPNLDTNMMCHLGRLYTRKFPVVFYNHVKIDDRNASNRIYLHHTESYEGQGLGRQEKTHSHNIASYIFPHGGSMTRSPCMSIMGSM